MKAAVIQQNGGLELQDLPVPTISENEILVRMHACGVCGTDLEKVRGHAITAPVLGHEVAGVVERVGESVREVEAGERVVVHHHVSCGTCYYCKNSFETVCESYPKSNLEPCGFAEFFRVSETLVNGGAVHPIASELNFESASQVEPTACCIRALRKVGIKAGETAAVFGLGPVGLTLVELLRLYGVAPVFAIDIIEKRRNLAITVGANRAFDPRKEDVSNLIVAQTERGVDCAVVATGNPKAMEQAMQSVRKGGRVLLFGAPARGTQLTFDASRMWIREINFLSSYSASEQDMQMALDLIQQRRISPSAMITHRFPLSKISDAFHVAGIAEDAGKVIVENP